MLERLHNNRGLTFIELMVAMLIMAITSLALYYMFRQGQVLLIEQERRLIVFEKAQKRLTSYRLLSAQELLEEGSDDGSEVIGRLDGDPDDSGDEEYLTAEYSVEVTVEENAYYKVFIEYTWEERSGRDYSITLVDCYPVDIDDGF